MLKILINDLRSLGYRLVFCGKWIMWKLVEFGPYVINIWSFCFFTWVGFLMGYDPLGSIIVSAILSLICVGITLWIDSAITRANPKKYWLFNSTFERLALDKINKAEDTLDEQLERINKDV